MSPNKDLPFTDENGIDDIDKQCFGEHKLAYKYADKEDKHMFLKDKGTLSVQVDGSHYKDMKIQPVEFITANAIPYREANVIKYTCRHKAKNGIKDIKKAIHYLEMIMEDYKRGELKCQLKR